MKDFVIYTAMRIGLFLACYAVFAGIAVLVTNSNGANLVWPFVAAVIVSAGLALKFLKGPRERFAARVQERAARATARFDELKAREDADADA
jgi:hypothetical protein